MLDSAKNLGGEQQGPMTRSKSKDASGSLEVKLPSYEGIADDVRPRCHEMCHEMWDQRNLINQVINLMCDRRIDVKCDVHAKRPRMYAGCRMQAMYGTCCPNPSTKQSNSRPDKQPTSPTTHQSINQWTNGSISAITSIPSALRSPCLCELPPPALL